MADAEVIFAGSGAQLALVAWGNDYTYTSRLPGYNGRFYSDFASQDSLSIPVFPSLT